MNPLGKVITGTAAAALAGGIGYYLYERNTEQPSYQLILMDGRFEIRDYPKLLVAETVSPGSRNGALNNGFQKLAAYIFAKSRGGDKIPMTAPVVQDREKIPMTAPVMQDEAGQDGWRTRFIMPASYHRETLPQPPEGVTISELPSRRVAVIRFSGRADDDAVAQMESTLRNWMSSRALHASAPAEYAFYNSPFIPGPLRRNEVLIPIQLGSAIQPPRRPATLP